MLGFARSGLEPADSQSTPYFSFYSSLYLSILRMQSSSLWIPFTHLSYEISVDASIEKSPIRAGFVESSPRRSIVNFERS